MAERISEQLRTRALPGTPLMRVAIGEEPSEITEDQGQTGRLRRGTAGTRSVARPPSAIDWDCTSNRERANIESRCTMARSYWCYGACHDTCTREPGTSTDMETL